MSFKKQLKRYVQKHTYISVKKLKNDLRGQYVDFNQETVKEYLHQLQNEGEIYDAGYGWYSTLQQEFSLDNETIKTVVENLEERFVFLEFSVWSTRQIRSYYHHLPGRFVTFVHAEKDTLDAVRDFLLDEHEHVYLNPGKQETNKNFRLEEDTYVVRPGIKEEPKTDHYARIEKIVVDLFVEMERLDLMDIFEFNRILVNSVMKYRVNMAKLLSYAKKRNRKDDLEKLFYGISAL